tara:strand:- start:468 stop:752 length:285 start_codon:yes stop_codon:yes gene_type:complete
MSIIGPNRRLFDGVVVSVVDDEVANLASSLTAVAFLASGVALRGELLLAAGRALLGDAVGRRFGDLRGLGDGISHREVELARNQLKSSVSSNKT